MIEWISNNSQVINAVSSVAMLIVWIAYLQVFLQSYRRQVRPKIIINRAAGSALGASCFIGNMSSEAIYIESVIITLNCDGHAISQPITDFDQRDEDANANDPRQRTLQGPLRPGDYTTIGTFDVLINKIQRFGREGEDGGTTALPIALEVLVIADYSSDDLLIGAKRTFRAEPKGENWVVQALTSETEQIRSRRARHKIKDMMLE